MRGGSLNARRSEPALSIPEGRSDAAFRSRSPPPSSRTKPRDLREVMVFQVFVESFFDFRARSFELVALCVFFVTTRLFVRGFRRTLGFKLSAQAFTSRSMNRRIRSSEAAPSPNGNSGAIPEPKAGSQGLQRNFRPVSSRRTRSAWIASCNACNESLPVIVRTLPPSKPWIEKGHSQSLPSRRGVPKTISTRLAGLPSSVRVLETTTDPSFLFEPARLSI